MRAKGTLAAFFVLLGTASLVTTTADAADRNTRNAQKQTRPGQAVLVTPPRPPALTASRVAASKAGQQPARTAVATATPAPAAARAQSAAALPPPPPPAPAHRGAAPAMLAAGQAPAQGNAMAIPVSMARPAVMPAIVAGAVARGVGTPIMPVGISSGLSCVPYARMATGMNVSGDARMWWYNAAGSYSRGSAPERGSILAFAASGGMSRGHVAVVSHVVNPRMIHIDHANWGGPGIRRGSVMRGVVVMDASERNDWTLVRVQVGHDDTTFGRPYATHGFIYNRPSGNGDRLMTASAPRFQEVAEGSSPHVAQHLRRASEMFAE